jgi:hypothetical protein
VIVLSRVQAFLPQLKSANEQLETVDPSKLDIENVEEEEGQYIEMVIYISIRLKRALRLIAFFFVESRSWCL